MHVSLFSEGKGEICCGAEDTISHWRGGGDILTWLHMSSQSDCRIAMFGWLTKDWVCLVG